MQNDQELWLEVVGSLIPPRLVDAVAAVRNRKKWSYAGVPDSTTAARRVLSLHITWPRTSDTYIPEEYEDDRNVRAAIAAPEVKDILVILLAEIEKCRSQGYRDSQVTALYRAVLRRRLQLANRRLVECGDLLIQSRKFDVVRLASSMHNNIVLTPQRRNLSASLRRLEQSRELLIRSRSAAVTDLRHRLYRIILDPQQSRFLAIQRRFNEIGSTWWTDFGDRVLSTWHDTMPSVFFSPDLHRDDVKLVNKWHQPRGEEMRAWYERVTSARRAEKSAISYFQQIVGDVRDISILQLDGRMRDWRTHDLSVDGNPIDVKNVRHVYGSFVVGDKPKETPLREEVPVFGVVSDPDGSRGQIVVGEAHRQELESLGAVVRKFCDLVDLPLRWSRVAQWKTGLAPWQMDFRPQHYRHRQLRKATGRFLGPDYLRFVESIDREGELDDLLGPLPNWVQGIMSFHHGVLHASGNDVVSALAEWHRLGVQVSSLAASRPAIFLFSLLFLLSAVKNGSWERNKTRSLLLSVLFVSDTDLAHEHPLGLHDPLRTIHTFVLALDELIFRNQDLLEELDELRLSGVGVLRGRRSIKEQEFTLLAHCGGCGRRPIWAGNLKKLHRTVGKLERPGQARTRPRLPSHEGCYVCTEAECFRLVCSECGFCGTKCSRCPQT